MPSIGLARRPARAAVGPRSKQAATLRPPNGGLLINYRAAGGKARA